MLSLLYKVSGLEQKHAAVIQQIRIKERKKDVHIFTFLNQEWTSRGERRWAGSLSIRIQIIATYVKMIQKVQLKHL
jgi:hypothetical protein